MLYWWLKSPTSLAYDRAVKVPRYCAARIAEVWIEDLTKELLLIYRSPADKGYAVSLTLHRGDAISPLAFPEVTFTIEDLLGHTRQ